MLNRRGVFTANGKRAEELRRTATLNKATSYPKRTCMWVETIQTSKRRCLQCPRDPSHFPCAQGVRHTYLITNFQISCSLCIGKPLPGLRDEVTIPSMAETASLYSRVAQSSGSSVHRLRITKGSDGSLVSNGKGLRVHDTGLRDGSTIYVKDLGESFSEQL